MSTNRRFQSGASSVEEPIGSQDSPYLTTEECARHLRFPSIRAFYKFIESPLGSELPRLYRGRVLLFDKRVVDHWLRQQGRAQKSIRRRSSPVNMKLVGVSK